MKKPFILVLAISTLSLAACEEEYALSNREPEPVAPMIITSFNPESAASGEEITLFGEEFGASISDTYLSFGGYEAEVLQVYSGSIVVRVPQDLVPGYYSISLSVRGRICTASKAFKVVEPKL